jgi:hypothetical protein
MVPDGEPLVQALNIAAWLAEDDFRRFSDGQCSTAYRPGLKPHPAAHPEKKQDPANCPICAHQKRYELAARRFKIGPAKPAAKQTGAPRAERKGAKVLEMIARVKGATLAEIMEATGWQAHTVRGFISISGKKGARIESSKNDAGERMYQLTSH